jgi:uncharacterized SAM-dependent methyltransferase
LRASKKELPCKYFYNEAGSALFEQIFREEREVETELFRMMGREYQAGLRSSLGRQSEA